MYTPAKKSLTNSLTPAELKLQAEQRFNEWDATHGVGYTGGWDQGTVVLDFLLWFGAAAFFIVVGPKILVIPPILAFLSALIQQANRVKKKRRSKPLLFGPLTAIFYKNIEREFLQTLQRNIDSKSYFTDTEKRERELFQLSTQVRKRPENVNKEQILFWMLNADRELRESEKAVKSALDDTSDAIYKLGCLTSTSAINELVEALRRQKDRLQIRAQELKKTREHLVDELTGTKEKFAALDKARTALDSLKLFEANKELLHNTELIVESAKSLCLEWSGKIESLELDTKALIHSLPEASEIYQVTA